ncbi:hypothetical protein B0H14DRAFT_139487 [Mycena olivaceomarginata]|nr:hypothetical protein B0H14DRAFT_139487 [Mycena olivaceomarginata]
MPSHLASENICDGNGRDSSKRGGDTAKADKSDTVQSMPVGPTHGSSTFNLTVYGGTGGSGGQGGEQGGSGGPGLRSIKEKLANHVAGRHKFTDQSKSLCAADTRVEIQADINRWLLPGSKTKEHIFWITGIAGSGKSTLSATVVENLCENKTPVTAQFFISRNIPETIDPAKIIPTIALQLAEFSPAAAGIIHNVLERGFPPTKKKQVEELLLAPILELCKSGDAVVILIDALDELSNAADSVKEILESIAPKGCDLPNVRFLITSRPERWAYISESETLELSVFKQHTLETSSSVDEVTGFTTARMMDITAKEPGWGNWPPPGDLQKLCIKADGLFHYAATALHWIEGQINEHGRACQSWVLKDLTQEGGLGQLEDLYRLILISFENVDKPALNEQRRRARLAGFQHVLGTILVLQKPLAISQIIALLADIPMSKLDVRHFLQQLRSVLIPGTTTLFEEATPQVHKSFHDYIMEGRAPAEFRILAGHAHFVTARSCLEVIIKAGSQSDDVVNYSVGHWYRHLRKAVEEGVTCEDKRMWNLFGQMVEKAAVDVWKENPWRIFIDLAAVGWELLKRGSDKHRMKEISGILIKAKVSCACFSSVTGPCLTHFTFPSRL